MYPHLKVHSTKSHTGEWMEETLRNESMHNLLEEKSHGIKWFERLEMLVSTKLPIRLRDH